MKFLVKGSNVVGGIVLENRAVVGIYFFSGKGQKVGTTGQDAVLMKGRMPPEKVGDDAFLNVDTIYDAENVILIWSLNLGDWCQRTTVTVLVSVGPVL